MKVSRLAWSPYHIPFRQPFATAHGTQTQRQGFLLQLYTDAGLVGLGEAAPVPGSAARAWPDAATLLAAMASLLPGRRLSEVVDALEPVSQSHPAAVAAVHCGLDTAVCDVLAQAADVPLGLWLAREAAETVPVNATVALPDVASAAKAAARARASGFPCVKLKVGMAGVVEAERERVAAVRKAVGERVKLRLDANGAWNVGEAISRMRALEPYDIELVEQPVACGDVEALRRVRAATDTPVAADEEIDSVAAADRVLRAGAAQVLVIKPMVVGGLRPARNIIERARARRVSCIVTTSLDTGVGIAAALHLAATLPCPAPACGLATGALLTTDLLTTPLTIERGRMRRPQAPGLGVRFDEKTVKRYSRPS
jgi:o-succinylbenzoate synthase